MVGLWAKTTFYKWRNKNLVAFIRAWKNVYTRDLYMAWDDPMHMKHKPSKVQ
jgi:hypothetical protein